MERSKVQPLVSIACITYNHEKYIRQCLDGFVMQITDFSFEIVIHDDASTDSTQSIIREYVDKYPNIRWNLILQEENKYRLGKGILVPYVYPECKGKYIALCEGDDYWIDPLKLQKQVDWLESHSEYSMCFHQAIEHWEDNSHEDRRFSFVQNIDYSGVEIYERWLVPTASVVFSRKVILSEYYRQLSQNRDFCYGDIVLFLSCAHLGKLRGMDFVGSVYRRHGDGLTFNTNQLSRFRHEFAIYEYIGGEYREQARRNFYNIGEAMIRDGNLKQQERQSVMLSCFCASPLKCLWWRTKILFRYHK